MEREDKRGIFFGIIGVLTLIVAIIGASLAYFSINAQSEKDAVIVQAATVKISYDDGDQIAISNIIPTSKAVALETVRRAGQTYTDQTLGTVEYQRCIDDNNRVVCGVYDFTLTNNGDTAVNITAKIVPTVEETNEEETETVEEGAEETTSDVIQFKNLKYALYDVTGVTAINENGTAIVEEGSVTYDSSFQIISNPIELAGNAVPKTYRLFIWLNDTGNPQDDEQGAVFKGTVYVEVSGTSNVTGNADKTLGTGTQTQ